MTGFRWGFPRPARPLFMDSSRRHELKERAHDVDVTVWVGKKGVDAAADEAKTQLEDRDLVKVKILRAGGDPEEAAMELAEEADAEVVDVRGRTAVVAR